MNFNAEHTMKVFDEILNKLNPNEFKNAYMLDFTK